MLLAKSYNIFKFKIKCKKIDQLKLKVLLESIIYIDQRY